MKLKYDQVETQLSVKESRPPIGGVFFFSSICDGYQETFVNARERNQLETKRIQSRAPLGNLNLH